MPEVVFVFKPGCSVLEQAFTEVFTLEPPNKLSTDWIVETLTDEATPRQARVHVAADTVQIVTVIDDDNEDREEEKAQNERKQLAFHTSEMSDVWDESSNLAPPRSLSSLWGTRNRADDMARRGVQPRPLVTDAGDG